MTGPFWLLPLALLLGACPGPIDLPDGGDDGALVVGPAGAIFVRPGYVLEVPPGAFTEQQTIVVTIVDTDIQSPGIHVLFGLANTTGPSLNDFLWGRKDIGEVTLVRRDRRHMTLSHFYAAWDFFCQMLDEEEDRAQHYTKAGFAAWNVERHERRANGNAASAFNAALLATW